MPPRWNDQGQMFQLSYEGRACCMSNKNVQLANVANESSPTLQAILTRTPTLTLTLTLTLTRARPRCRPSSPATPTSPQACP